MWGCRPKATDMGWKRVGQRSFDWQMVWPKLVLFLLGLLMISLFVNEWVIKPSIDEHLGSVMVYRVLGSASDRYAGFMTWTVTFVEKSTQMQLVEKTEPTYNVIYNGGTVQAGQRFELCKRHDGRYIMMEERAER